MPIQWAVYMSEFVAVAQHLMMFEKSQLRNTDTNNHFVLKQNNIYTKNKLIAITRQFEKYRIQ